MRPEIKLENITKSYDKINLAISNINIEIFQGEIFGLIGPNGSGKTTIIKILKGLISPSSGSFIISNIVYNPNNLIEIKKMTAFLPENDILLGFLSVNEFLTLIALLYNVSENIAKKRIKSITSLFNLSHYLSKKIRDLSEGTKQRVAWVSTLITNCQIILLDDPLRALDQHSFQLIVDLIKHLKEQNKTVVLATHYLSLAEAVCDKLTFIKEGEIVITGRIEELLSNSQLKNLKDLYLDIYPNPFDLTDIKKMNYFAK